MSSALANLIKKRNMLLVFFSVLCFLHLSVADAEKSAVIGLDGVVASPSSSTSSRCPERSMNYAISITTIPPRIPHLHNVIGSWLNQETTPPTYIFIFVPKQYKRFKRKGTSGTGESFKCMTERILMDQLGSMSWDATIYRECPTPPDNTFRKKNDDACSTIRVVEVDTDWGPATKYLGFIDFRLRWEAKWTAEEAPAYWVVGDDDVRYASNTWSLYEAFIDNDPAVTEREQEAARMSPSPPVGPHTVLTHFSADYRQMLHLEHESFTRPVLHLQGVDTVAFPSNLLRLHESDQCPRAPGKRALPCTLALDRMRRALLFLHERCPTSFYQDDYVMSLLVNLGNTDVRSTYLVGRKNVARHVDGVSKHYSQMHMSDKVGLREEQTKACLLESVEPLLKHLQ